MSAEKWITKGVSFPTRYRHLVDYAEMQASAEGRNFSNWVVRLIELDREAKQRQAAANSKIAAAADQAVKEAAAKIRKGSKVKA